MGDPIATFSFALLEGSHLQVHVNWGHESMGRQIRNQKSEITNRQLWRKEPDLKALAQFGAITDLNSTALSVHAGGFMSQTAESEASTDAGSKLARFPNTHWTLVLEAARGEPGRSQEALGQLCVLYREPIRSWLRRSGAAPDAVDDLTQCFIEHLLEGNRLKNVEQRETKFRTYLIECIRRLVRGEWRKAMAAKRGSGLAPVELDETAVGLTVDPERHMDQDFALAVHQRALDRLATGRFSGEPKRTRFQHLQPLILGYDPETSYAEIGSRLGMSANHVKKAVFDLRHEYYEVFRDEVNRLVRPDLIDEETRYLMTLLAGSSATDPVS